MLLKIENTLTQTVEEDIVLQDIVGPDMVGAIEISTAMKIAPLVGPLPPTRSITRNELKRTQSDFRLRYLAITKTTPSIEITSNFVDEFAVNWLHFKGKINTFLAQSSVNPDNLLLRFIHRYDLGNWSLTGQCCTMSSPRAHPTIIGKNIVDVTDTNYLFRLSNTHHIDMEANPGHYANDYFNNFYFTPTGTPPPASDNLATIDPNHERYVGNVLFLWKEEILQLGIDNYVWNNSGDLLDANKTVYLKFASCTFQYPPSNPYSNIEFPHGVVIYLNVDGRDLLLEESHILSYTNMACDFGNLCPPNCGIAII